MARRAMLVVASVATLAALVAPASARPDEEKGWRAEGCVAVGTHTVSVSGVRPWDCYFVATGPAYFVAATTNPFSISVWDTRTNKYVDVLRRGGTGAPTAGRVPLKPGDQVGVSISCWDYTANSGCRDALGGRYGTLAVHSQL